ncbi:MAG: PLP-dependent aminotransferase family protein [Firmicutes bacterium]|nr:PLP-dependent aminotransferase family protein [Bacillota bacterium]
MTIKWQNYYAERTKHITGSQIRQFFALTERPEVISFAGGFPGNEFFPCKDISAALAALVLEDGKQALQYTSTEGSAELRTYLAEKMTGEGAFKLADNLIITDGSQQGLDLLSRILVNPGDAVLVEEPAYIGGMSAIKSYGGIPVGIKMDEEGVIPSVMEKTIKRLKDEGKNPKIFYTVPNFQNPTGYTTSLQRRQAVMAIAYRYNLVIIEDNPYGNLCYEGEVPTSYVAMDEREQVIYLGSYSKILIPGIRIGWMAGPKSLIEKVSLAKQTTNLCSSTLGQQLAYRLSESGYVDLHINKLIDLYREKRDRMLNSMKHYFPADIEFSEPKGGFFIWVKFPEYYPPSREILNIALKYNVAFVHGEGFFSDSKCGSHGARFSFSQPNSEEIETGIKILGSLLHTISENKTLEAVGQ